MAYPFQTYMFSFITVSPVLNLDSRAAQDSRRPKGAMLKTFKKSVGRSFKRNKLFSKYLDPATSGKPGNVASSENEHERELSELRGVIPRFSSSEGEPSNRPVTRGWCPMVLSSVVSHPSRSRTVNNCDRNLTNSSSAISRTTLART